MMTDDVPDCFVAAEEAVDLGIPVVVRHHGSQA
jgi:hypothetical protein